MQFQNLTVHNLGVFRGRHDFDLAAERRPSGDRRHLTIISGHNGSGKSTLFQAIALALYGPQALGNRVGRREYSDFLLSRMHRHTEAGEPVISDIGGVALGFHYVQSGQPRLIQVERGWQHSGQNVLEELTVLCDGKPPEVAPADYQTWLNDLIAPGLASVCFFDAERLDAWANPEQHGGLLGETLRRLLGLDLVERLQSDLDHYISLQTRRREAGRLREEVLQHQANVDALNVRLAQLQLEDRTLANERARLETELAQHERRLAAEGGRYAARRPVLQERLEVVKAETESIVGQLRELCANVLPFTLAPELCQSLAQRLTQEAKIHRQRIAGEVWQEQRADLKRSLQGDDLWQGIDVPTDTRSEIVQRMGRLLQESRLPYAADEGVLVHRLAEPEQEQVQSWIVQALHVVPQQAQALGDRLRALQEERHSIEADLRRAPDDEVLVPIHAEIARSEAALADARQRQASLNEQIGVVQFQLGEQVRKLHHLGSQFAAAQASDRQVGLAERSKLVLRAYQDVLTRQRLAALEGAAVNAFNAICRKERLLAAVHISSEDLRVQLQDAGGHLLGLGDLSAGERQLYALALLWALRQVSKQQLPLVMDTPLARLDEVHRWRLLHHYVPFVSDQVLLFATDAELDSGLLAEVEPYLARVYRLNYDSKGEETAVTQDAHPAPRGVILYRSEIVDAASFSLQNGDGQTWTTDPERAAAYANGLQGNVKRALLPATARRLVLVDPVTSQYNWADVAELERLTDEPFVARRLRDGKQIYDIWRPQWTERVQKAGYDSIAAVGIEGPEEWVLDPAKLAPLGRTSSTGKETDYVV